ncbi:MAG TPA: hypothetical protein VJ947_09645, partial [Pseudohaliea sp.]|nr:hypothetical protein [Pseudohaliea sp.]
DRFLGAFERQLWPLACVGVAVFVAVAALTLAFRGGLLDLPPARAGTLILIIEGFALLSIAVALVALFLGTGEGEDRER